MENDFLNKITDILVENLSNERFGVSELAHEMGMSRSNLLRKVKKHAKLSVSQFIRQVRLQKSMEMLKQGSLNVSEASYQVGFGSTSYFIKCFREYYGYPPGEVGKRDTVEVPPGPAGHARRRRWITAVGSAFLLVCLAGLLFLLFRPSPSSQPDLEKSIAVLPFINDSEDPANVYIINGLMESILNHLQHIEDLRVVSRTSVEKYRNAPRTIPEIAAELNVNYFVEGSGQKIGDQILLNIQLIEARTDRHLWTEQYNREVKDIFNLQKEIAQHITDRIHAIITPEEEARISKIPTDDLVAYDFFLKGLDFMYRFMDEGGRENLEEAIRNYRKATEHDGEFARAYAGMAISYYYMDLDQAEKQYSDQINHFADRALLFDPQLPQSLMAKSLYHINNNEYEKSLPYLEKALEYNPNSALVINLLSDFYANRMPDRHKYLEYALKGVQLDIAANDSVTASFIFLHLSNALLQSGFVAEAEKFISKSLTYYPENLFAAYTKPYILFARDRDLQQTRELLTEVHQKDTTRYDILQEVGKICYYMRDYESAYHYYNKLIRIRETNHLDIYRGENAKIGVVLDEVGKTEMAEKYFEDYLDWAENVDNLYRHLSLAVYHSYTGDRDKAIEHLERFSRQDNYQYLIIPFLQIDPLIDNIKDLPAYKRIIRDMEIKFWRSHKKVRASLKEKNLL